MGGNDRKLVIPQERDLHLLRELAVMRVVDREQAKSVATFGSTSRANARLLALTEAGYLRRYFWGSVGGARKSLYSLSARGADLAGVPYRRPRRGQDEVLAIDSLAAHQLAVNEIYITLKYCPVPDGAQRLRRWTTFEAPLAGMLIPDGYAEIGAAGRPIALFVEIDRGTEGRSVWQAKVRAYLSYAASDDFARDFGIPQFRTLAIVKSEPRLTSLRGATATVTEKIFRFSTFERIERNGFWSAVWQKPKGDERQTLL